jgi:hypothetical protein
VPLSAVSFSSHPETRDGRKRPDVGRSNPPPLPRCKRSLPPQPAARDRILSGFQPPGSLLTTLIPYPELRRADCARQTLESAPHRRTVAIAPPTCARLHDHSDDVQARHCPIMAKFEPRPSRGTSRRLSGRTEAPKVDATHRRRRSLRSSDDLERGSRLGESGHHVWQGASDVLCRIATSSSQHSCSHSILAVVDVARRRLKLFGRLEPGAGVVNGASDDAGADVMNGPPPCARPVKPCELATVGQAHRPTTQDRLEDDRGRALHRTYDHGSPLEEDPKKSLDARSPKLLCPLPDLSSDLGGVTVVAR